MPKLPQVSGKETIKALQKIGFTVAGQKAVFRSMIEVFRAQPRRDLKALELVGKKASNLIERGFFSRKRDDENPFFGLMFDAKEHKGPLSQSLVYVSRAARET